MASKILNAVAGAEDTPLVLGNIKIPCYVLEDETRVLSGRGIQNAIGFPKRGGGNALSAFLSKKEIAGLIDDETRSKFDNKVVFKRIGSGGSVPQTYGYDATLLIDLCDIFIRAKKAGLLTVAQEIYAEQCELIIRAVAKVGIIALIDEATGYQAKRTADALKLLLEKYLRTEHAVWVKRFPVEFFKEIYRLRNWKFDPQNIKNHPQIVGSYINDIVYARLAPGILEELQNLNKKNEKGNRSYRHHQFLTDDIGSPALQQHLFAVIALMRASGSWEGFMRLLNKSLPKKNAQLFLELDE